MAMLNAPTMGCARIRHVATDHARELAGDGETQPSSAEALRGRCVSLGEFLEQFRLLLSRHADRGVGDGEFDPVASLATLCTRSVISPCLVNLKALRTFLCSRPEHVTTGCECEGACGSCPSRATIAEEVSPKQCRSH